MFTIKFSKLEYYLFYIISVLLHPIFVPSFVFVFLFHNKNSIIYNFHNYKTTLTALIMLFVFSVIIPIILILFMKLIKIIGSVVTPTKTERILISLIISIFIFELYLFYSKIYPFNILFRRYLVIMILLIIFTIILKFSYHSYGAGSMLGLTLLYYFSSISKYLYDTDLYVLFLLFLLSGFMLTSRIVTGAHNFTQIIKGFVLGTISSIVTFIIF